MLLEFSIHLVWTITNPEFLLVLNHGRFVIVHGWQNENNKMAENFCFLSVCTEFRKNRTCQVPKRLQIGSEDLQRYGEKVKPHINDKSTPICVKI